LSRAISPLSGRPEQPVDDGFDILRAARALGLTGMNDDQAMPDLEALRVEHRRLDEEIALRSADGSADQMELARLKRRKLRLKDQIQMIAASNIPDIIA
jgi:hypothetical protein